MLTEMTCQPALAPDKSIAADFLKRLDPERGEWLFVAIREQKCKKGGADTLLKRGTVNECWPWICGHQQNGRGIFFPVGRTEGKRRKKEDITFLPGLFLDFDNPGMPEPIWPEGCPPIITVTTSIDSETGRPKRHCYWPCDDLPLEEFDRLERALVERYVPNGADQGVKDRPRILRLPGTLHLKNPAKPHLVTFEALANRASPYSSAELRAAFEPRNAPVPQSEPVAQSEPSKVASGPSMRERARLEDALRYIPMHDRETWFKVLGAIRTAFGDTPYARALSVEVSKGSDRYGGGKYDPQDQEKTWKSCGREVENPVRLGTLYRMAKENGWPGLEPTSHAVVFPELSPKGVPRNHWRNAQAALRALGIKVAFDEFKHETSIEGLGNHRVFTDAAATDLRCAFQDLGFDLKLPDVFEYVDKIARDNSYHPVREYLDNHRWDGVPRLDQFFPRYTGAEDTPLNRAAGAIFMIAAVRRVRDPGTKFDLMPVLEGSQGTRKSSFLRTLAVQNEWFSDGVSMGLAAREMIELTSGKCMQVSASQARLFSDWPTAGCSGPQRLLPDREAA